MKPTTLCFALPCSWVGTCLQHKYETRSSRSPIYHSVLPPLRKTYHSEQSYCKRLTSTYNAHEHIRRLTAASILLAMPPRLIIPANDPRRYSSLSDDAGQSSSSSSGRKTPQLRPTSWINYQHEKQRSSELKKARTEEERRLNVPHIKSETPMIEWTSAFFRKLFRRK